MTSVRSLYLPVENLARELDGKLPLALVARERGWRSVIGYKAAIRGHRSILPPGIYLAHNARQSKPVFFERFGRFGHQSVVLDEEALVRQTDEIFLMKHESDAIRERFGDYVLLNTNFPTVNHFVAWSSTLKPAKSVTDARVIEQKSEFLSHKQALFERFQLLIPKLARAIAPLTPEQSSLLGHHIAGTSGRLSCECIIDAFDRLGVAGEGLAEPGYLEWCRRCLKVQWHTRSQRVREALSASGRLRLAYAGRKFPAITPRYLDDRIGRFQQSLDRFHGLRARRMAANLFAIE